jgi:hypothetical protein
VGDYTPGPSGKASEKREKFAAAERWKESKPLVGHRGMSLDRLKRAPYR